MAREARDQPTPLLCPSSIPSLFRELQGEWNLRRRIASATASLPSGDFDGKAIFTPVGGEGEYGATRELLYEESGIFRSECNTLPEFRATKQYIYALELDTIQVYFVKTDGVSRDAHFHQLDSKEGCSQTQVGELEPAVLLTVPSAHCCGRDLYQVRYHFVMNNAGSLQRFRVVYSAKGPRKNYWTEGWYTRTTQKGIEADHDSAVARIRLTMPAL